MSLAILVATGAWFALLIAAFIFLPARRAIIVGFIGGWLFLPVVDLTIPHLPDYTKMNVTCLGVLVCGCLFDGRRFLSFRPRWFDLPMLLWCVSPFASSIVNGLGAYDGLSAAFRQTTAWGVPYLIGRVYFDDLCALRELAIGIFVGGLIYVPLSLYEIMAGPVLHYSLYGLYPSPVAMEIRFGGWRPMVFMSHGLMVGFWMAAATIIGFWLWRSGAVSRLGRIPSAGFVLALGATTVLVKSVNAWLYLLLGAALYIVITRFRSALPIYALLILIPVYLAARSTGLWSGAQVIPIVQSALTQDKAESLAFRFQNEEVLAERAREQPVFGWAAWGRNLVTDQQGYRITTADSLWISAFGQYGAIGLIALTALLLAPVLAFVAEFSVAQWAKPTLAPVTGLAIVLLLYAIDNLVNAMINPVFMLAAGGLLTWPAIAAEKVTEPETVLEEWAAPC